MWFRYYTVEELNVRLNKNTGEWDWDVLANEFEVLFNPDDMRNNFKFRRDRLKDF